MNLVWIYTCVFGFLMYIASSSDDCNVVGQHLSYCTETYNVEPQLVKGIPFFTNVSEFQLFCRRVDELLSCFHGVFGHCSVMFYDYEAYEATFHDICRNMTFAIDAFDGCIDQTNYLIQTCMLHYRTETIQLYRSMAGEFLNPEVQCELYSHLRQCLAWNITETCSSEHSSFLTKVFRRRFTPTLCEGIYNLEKDNAGSKNGGGPLKSNKVVFVLIFFFRFGFSQPVG